MPVGLGYPSASAQPPGPKCNRRCPCCKIRGCLRSPCMNKVDQDTPLHTFHYKKWLNMQSCRIFNLPSGWIIILQKREKSRFRPAFGVCSTQNLVEIFNNQFFVLTQNYFEETRFLKIEQFTELSCMTLLASIQTSFFPIKYF